MEQTYNKDAYCQQLQTTVSDIIKIEDITYIKCADSIFHPRKGGQRGDRGTITINDVNYIVVDTLKDETASPLMQLASDMDASMVGQVAHCKLDWPYRYSQMQLHSGLHLIHCALETILGANIHYPRLANIENENTALVQYENVLITEDVFAQVVDIFNDMVSIGFDIKTYPDLEKPDYRWWQCHTHTIACGGTHVANTNEIKDFILQFKIKKQKQTIRITRKDA